MSQWVEVDRFGFGKLKVNVLVEGGLISRVSVRGAGEDTKAALRAVRNLIRMKGHDEKRISIVWEAGEVGDEQVAFLSPSIPSSVWDTLKPFQFPRAQLPGSSDVGAHLRATTMTMPAVDLDPHVEVRKTRRLKVLQAIALLEEAHATLNAKTHECVSCDRQNADNHDEWSFAKKLTETITKLTREVAENPCLLP